MKYYKFLNDNLSSYHSKDFYYPAPTLKNGKWIPSEWVEEKDCEKSDQPCGKGLHLMKVLIPKYTPYRGNCYEAEGIGLLGEDDDKARFKKIRLIRPIPRDEILKPYADLSSANLSSADLRFADLRYANLSSTNLRSANLRSADLSSANLSSADLRYADLRYADLRYADLRYAKNLDFAYWDKFTQIDHEYKKLLSEARFVK